MITSDFWVQFKATLDSDAFWDTLNVTGDIQESAFETLGAIAKKIQQGGSLTLIEIQRLSIAVEKVSAWSADFVGKIDSTTARPLTPDEISLVRYIRQERATLDVVAVQLRQAVDSVNVGGLTPERASAVASKVVPFLSKAGPLLGAAHVVWAGVSEGPSKATEAAVGFAAAWLATTGVAALALKSGLIAAGAVSGPVGWAVILGVATVSAGAGLLAGKGAEKLWSEFGEPFVRRIFPDGSSPASSLFAAEIGAADAALTELDGTWLEGTSLTPEQKSAFSAFVYLSDKSISVTETLFADVRRHFETPFAAGELLERDKALAVLVDVARELGPGGYTARRVAVDGNQVTIDIPASASRAREALRQLMKASVLPAEQAFVSPTLPAQLIISLGGGTRTAGAGGALLAGSSVAETLSGGAGADTLLGAGGADTLHGGASYDTLFGGEGDDVLVGGAGSDWLLGGSGADRYEFAGGDGSDTIIDADGLGSIWFQGQQVTGGKKAATDSWISDDRQFGFTRIANAGGGFDLIVSRGSELGRGSHDLVFALPRASPAAPIYRLPQTESVRAVSS
jgi:hypothetical protein